MRDGLPHIPTHFHTQDLFYGILTQINLSSEASQGRIKRDKELSLDAKPQCPAIRFPVHEFEIFLYRVMFTHKLDEVMP